MLKRHLPSLALLFCLASSACHAPAQDKYNLSFDKLDTSRQPAGWILPHDTSTIRLDSTDPQNGKYAICIDRTSATTSPFNAFSATINPPVSGDMLKLTGYIRTQDVANGYAGLWMRIQDNANTVIGFKGMQDENLHGTNPWKEYTIEIPYSSKNAATIIIGGLLAGQGKAWIDNLHLYIDDKPIDLIAAKPPVVVKTIDNKTIQDASAALTRDYTPEKLDHLADFARIWGFLKYYHPAITGGQRNWDSTLVSLVPRILTATPQKAWQLEEAMIDNLGPVPACSDCTKDDSSRVRLRPDYGGLFAPNHLPPSLTKKLAFIRDNYNGKNDGYYLNLSPNGGSNIHNENNYGSSPYPAAIVRLITLFRYWNIMEYFYPDRNLITPGWNTVLPELIPVFIHAADKNEYFLACIKMIAHLHDSHAGVTYIGTTKDLDSLKGLYMIPAETKFIENALVVIRYFGADSSTVKTGDIIKKIDGVPIADLVKKYLPLTTGSNEDAQLRDLTRPNGWLMRNNNQTATLTIEHDGHTKDLSVRRQPYYSLPTQPFYSDIPNSPAYKLLDQNIGYIVPDKLKDKDIDTIRTLFKNTRGIIIDMRCYPSTFMPFSFGAWLKASPSAFAFFTINSTKMPGTFVQTGPVYNGGGQTPTYAGRLAIIVNSTTQSQAEYTTIALRTVPGAFVVGSRTAGADGNVTQFSLPGNIATAFSGLGVYYPDWSETQRVGVRIDVPIKPTIKAIREGRDEYLDTTIKLMLEQNDSKN